MRFHLIAYGNKMPKWISEGYLEYAKRFPRDFPVTLTEIPLKKIQHLSTVLTAIRAPKTITIALDVQGQPWSTKELATGIVNFQKNASEINFIIGGPDGLDKEILAKANYQWSLSRLTLPHPLVRVLLIEQLYRAVSIINHHPYHRA